ncbi:MAG: right-handed parallel beta-helix repeat-containing protein [Pyrinomonadaceae bacterium]|nr:right-handed parallel beta-helix repeat-containing protein [Pyrinomonadaceae bacterium]
MQLILIIVTGLVGIYLGAQPSRQVPATSAVMGTATTGAATPPQTRPRPRVASSPQGNRTCDATRQPGADIGAKVNACDRTLGPGPGEIALSGGGTIATQILLSPGHTLRLIGKGVYPSRVEGPVVILDNNTALVCESWDAILEEGTAPEASPGVGYGRTGQSVFTIVQSRSGITSHAAKNERLRVEGCHFRGARKDFNSAVQTVSLGNCENCVARNNWFESVRTIALQAGGTAEKRNAARNILFENNLFTGSASQNLALTNVVGAIVRKNRFIAPGISGGPGTAVIDVEPNTNDVVDNVLIEGNLIDATEAPGGPNGAQTICGIVVNALNPTTGFRNVRVVGNTIIGSTPTAPSGRISYAGILIRGAPGVLVERNFIQRVNRGVLMDYGASATVVRGNTLLSCGSGGTGAIEISDSSNNVVIDNVMDNAPGETVYSAVTSKGIAQSGSSRNNRIENNGPRNRK